MTCLMRRGFVTQNKTECQSPNRITARSAVLNTRNGCMSQIQIVKGEVRETPINLVPLVSASEEQNGRFTLYEGKYVSQSVLLDRISGKVWYVFFGALNPKDNRIEETVWHSGEE